MTKGRQSDSRTARKASSGVISRGVIIRSRLRHTSSASCSATERASRRSPSVTTSTPSPSSGTSSQGWAGNSDTSRVGPVVRESARRRTSDMGPMSVRIPSAGTSMGRLARAMAGATSPRTVLTTRRAIRSPVEAMSMCGSVWYPTMASASSTIRSVTLAWRSRQTPSGTGPIRRRATSIKAASASKIDPATIAPWRDSTSPSRGMARASSRSSSPARYSYVPSVTRPDGSAHAARSGTASAPDSSRPATAPANSVFVPARDREASSPDRSV